MPANTEVENAEEAVDRALSLRESLYARAGFDSLAPFEDDVDAQLFTQRVKAAFDEACHDYVAISDDSIEAEKAREALNDDREAIAGWIWATENYDNWVAFKQEAQKELTSWQNYTGA